MNKNNELNRKMIISKLNLNSEEKERIFEIDGDLFYEEYLKEDRKKMYFEEILYFMSTPIKPFITIKYPKSYTSITHKEWNACIKLFKYHLVDCGVITNIKDIKGLWGLDYSNEKETIIRFVFDCGPYYFESCKLLQDCLDLFKQRILICNRSLDFKNRFMFKGEDSNLCLLIDTQMIKYKKTEIGPSFKFRLEIFGSSKIKSKTIGFLSAIPNSEWVIFDNGKLQLQEDPSLNSRYFPLSKDEFNKLLVSYLEKKHLIVGLIKNDVHKFIDISYYMNRMYLLYSSQEFDSEAIWKLIGHKNREISFDFNLTLIENSKREKEKERYLFFDNEIQFKNAILKNCPNSIHFGPIYNSRSNINSETIPFGKELIFDLDLDSFWRVESKEIEKSKESDKFFKQINIRYCCRDSKKQACEKCWKIALYASRFLKVILEDMFGFSKLTFVFSGKKGFHCIVSDQRVLKLNQNERKDILTFISNRQLCRHKNYPVFNRIYSEFALLIFKEILQDQGDSLKNEYDQLKRKMGMDGEQAPILFLLWPRFDDAVTIQLNHLTKIPLGFHSDTLRKCITFDPFCSTPPFNPFSL